jgi:drug/metabolite transporter (DMT)-like permease
VAAVALALGASLAWGVSDFYAGLQSRRLPLLTVLAVSQAVGLAVIALIVAARGHGPPSAGPLALAAGSALAGLGGLAAFYRGLAVGAMSVVAPVSATAAAIPVAYGLATGDRPTALQAAGMAAALAGVILASREEDPERGGGGTRLAAGFGLALIAALGFGTFFVAIGRASDHGPLWAILANRVAGVALLWTLVALRRPKLGLARGSGGRLAAIGCLDMGANAGYALATTEGLVSLVAVLASLYPAVVIALAHLVLGERIRPSQRVGVAAALAGVAMIAAG